jgi:hypothetical protein
MHNFSSKHLLSALTATLVLVGAGVAVNAPAQASPTEASIQDVAPSQPESPDASAQAAIGFELENESYDLDVRARDQIGNTSFWLDRSREVNFTPSTVLEQRIYIDGRTPGGLNRLLATFEWRPAAINRIIVQDGPERPRVIICYTASGCTE